ncbi:hypothetical protein HMPREF1552_00820 [Leptotrichia sp. oral taxon 879 str. F0557]|nr:hypothetical protein HMPREF1552_00820 [Leptotrichia sp. oral taxon 879 str. F0557]
MEKYNQFEIFRFLGSLAVIFSHVSYNMQIPRLLKSGPAWVFFFFLSFRISISIQIYRFF